MTYKTIHRIGLSILIIGLINLYNIFKKGLIINLPINLNIIDNNIIKLEQNNIKIIIIIVSLFFFIFSAVQNNLFNSRTEKIEYDLIIGLGLLGLIFLIISNDLIILFLGLELYSFSIYFLILVKETISLRRIAIYYFIISSISSAILLFIFSQFYTMFSSLNIEYIYNIINTIDYYENNYLNLYIFLIILVFLFKLGTGPFINWLIRVYLDLDKKILLYQLLIPKLIFFILIIKFSYFIPLNSFNIFSYIIYIFAIISIIVGSIGGLFQTKDNSLLTYSSILNIGYILLTYSILLLNISLINLDSIYLLIENNKIWIIYQYFIIYFINLLGLFSILFLYRRTSNITLFNSFFLQPFFFISFLLLIFSFIGLPPLSGFFSKFYLFFTFISFSTLSYYSLILFIFSTLISSLYYFKFLFSSSSSNLTINNNSILIINEPNFYSYLLAFSTIFSLIYSLYISTIIPLISLSFSF